MKNKYKEKYKYLSLSLSKKDYEILSDFLNEKNISRSLFVRLLIKDFFKNNRKIENLLS